MATRFPDAQTQIQIHRKHHRNAWPEFVTPTRQEMFASGTRMAGLALTQQVRDALEQNTENGFSLLPLPTNPQDFGIPFQQAAMDLLSAHHSRQRWLLPILGQTTDTCLLVFADLSCLLLKRQNKGWALLPVVLFIPQNGTPFVMRTLEDKKNTEGRGVLEVFFNTMGRRKKLTASWLMGGQPAPQDIDMRAGLNHVRDGVDALAPLFDTVTGVCRIPNPDDPSREDEVRQHGDAWPAFLAHRAQNDADKARHAHTTVLVELWLHQAFENHHDIVAKLTPSFQRLELTVGETADHNARRVSVLGTDPLNGMMRLWHFPWNAEWHKIFRETEGTIPWIEAWFAQNLGVSVDREIERFGRPLKNSKRWLWFADTRVPSGSDPANAPAHKKLELAKKGPPLSREGLDNLIAWIKKNHRF